MILQYTFIHPSSVNHRKRVSMVQESGEKQLYAFAEKRQNISAPGAASQKYLMTTTRLDPMTYMLFGAYNLQVTERGLECDEWLPIVGNVDGLDQIQRLKVLMDSCMLRVFEGITVGRERRRSGAMVVVESEEEDEKRDYSLSATEVKELDIFTRDIVRILNRYSEERIGTQSRSATPMGSPWMGSVRLPPSGYSTPYGGSRSSTPSRLSRRMF
jgi:small subunit ribosomal protein S24e